MAIIRLNYPSKALAHNTELTVILPDPGEGWLTGKEQQAGTYQVLYLLHGTHGDHSDWSRYTSIERYARERCLAVVMPSCGNAFYQDMVSGPQYKTFLLDELPNYLGGILPCRAGGRMCSSPGCRWAAMARCTWRWSGRRSLWRRPRSRASFPSLGF